MKNEAKSMETVEKEELESFLMRGGEKKESAEEGRVINTQTNRR